jgi:hypothetical protein
MWCRRSSFSLKRVSGRYASSLGSDSICELASSTLRYGPSSTSEVGHDLAYMNAKRFLLFVDPHVASLDPFETVVSSIEKHVPAGHVLDIYNKIRVEPNNDSFKHAIKFMMEKTTNQGPYDAIIALGGGSTIDTAKAANLYTCYPPDDFYDYVNPPLGKGLPVPGPLTPLIAIPTTSGTASHHKSSMYLAICNCKLHERHRRAVSITSLFVQSEEDIKIVSSAGVMLVFVSSTSHLINVLIISAATTLRKAH